MLDNASSTRIDKDGIEHPVFEAFPDWTYWDYLEHGIFPGIDDYIEAMGGYIDPWTGEDIRDKEGNDASLVG